MYLTDKVIIVENFYKDPDMIRNLHYDRNFYQSLIQTDTEIGRGLELSLSTILIQGFVKSLETVLCLVC